MERVKIDNTQNDLYKYYISNKKYSKTIKKGVFHSVIKKFNREMVKLILYKSKEFKFPYRLGSLRILKVKARPLKYDENGNIVKQKLNVNWKARKELWQRNAKAKEEKKLVLHLNEHTNEYRYRFYWNKRTAKFKNKESYKFTPSRENKRWLASILKDETLKIDYFE